MATTTKNQIEVEFLADGSVRITTGTFDGPKHGAAEALLADIAAALGATKRTRKVHTHVHLHEHDHEHDHDHDHQHEGNK